MTDYKSLHKETLKIIKDGLKTTKNNYKQKFINKLQQERGYWSKFRHHLFLNPSISFFVLAGIWLGIIIISLVFDMRNRDPILKVIFIFISMICLFIIPFSLLKFTPKLEIGWDALWKDVSKYYLQEIQERIESNSQNSSRFKSFQLTIYNLFNSRDEEELELYRKQAKENLTRAMLYYKRGGQPLNLIIELLGGGIFIGCLPDSNFQQLLMTLDMSQILKCNLFGGVSIIVTPFLFVFYCIKYDFPAAWIENVLTQIELEE